MQASLFTEEHRIVPTPGPLPKPTAGPDAIVYGYQAYWAADLGAVPWDELTHIALFNAEVHTDGSLTHTSRWSDAATALSLAEPYGVHVHLCITNFSPSEIDAILGSATVRSTLVDNLADWVEQTGVHGINVDLEGVRSTQRTNLVTFTSALAAEVGEVVLATPSVDWSDAWNYAALAEHADLFIMGYGYHWSGSSYAGPVDPLHGDDPWSNYALDWTIDDYLDAGADPARVILGLPLYGYAWPTASDALPAATTGSGSAIFWASMQDNAAAYGERFDEVSRTPWWYDGSRQGWYGNVDSLRERIEYAIDAGIGGVGFWALHYDEGDEELWAMVHEATTEGDEPEPPPPDGEFLANAGRPFLAYVGDTVILSGARSKGPEGVALEYQWTQLTGAPVLLSDVREVEPWFDVEDPGTLVFELVVGDGTNSSEPDRSYVIVLDEERGRRHLGGCATVPLTGAGVLVLALAFGTTGRRRRRSG